LSAWKILLPMIGTAMVAIVWLAAKYNVPAVAV
jgi:hypothetical protein